MAELTSALPRGEIPRLHALSEARGQSGEKHRDCDCRIIHYYYYYCYRMRRVRRRRLWPSPSGKCDLLCDHLPNNVWNVEEESEHRTNKLDGSNIFTLLSIRFLPSTIEKYTRTQPQIHSHFHTFYQYSLKLVWKNGKKFRIKWVARVRVGGI